MISALLMTCKFSTPARVEHGVFTRKAASGIGEAIRSRQEMNDHTPRKTPPDEEPGHRHDGRPYAWANRMQRDQRESDDGRPRVDVHVDAQPLIAERP